MLTKLVDCTSLFVSAKDLFSSPRVLLRFAPQWLSGSENRVAGDIVAGKDKKIGRADRGGRVRGLGIRISFVGRELAFGRVLLATLRDGFASFAENRLQEESLD
jgi:hypothetical protein